VRLSVNVQKPKVFQLQGALAPVPLTRDEALSEAPGSRWGLCPQALIIGASHLYLGGLQLYIACTA